MVGALAGHIALGQGVEIIVDQGHKVRLRMRVSPSHGCEQFRDVAVGCHLHTPCRMYEIVPQVNSFRRFKFADVCLLSSRGVVAPSRTYEPRIHYLPRRPVRRKTETVAAGEASMTGLGAWWFVSIEIFCETTLVGR